MGIRGCSEIFIMGVGICSLFTKTRYSGVLAGIVIFIQLSYISCLTSREKQSIQRGIEAGRSVADLLGNFEGTVSNIATSIGPFLGALGPFVGMVLSFIPIESPVLAELKRMMERIDNRFDRVDSQFNDVKNMINWSVVRVNFGQIEQKILAVSEEYEHMYKVPRHAAANRKAIFLNSYDSDYQNSGYKLYRDLSDQRRFEQNLGTSIMHYTKNNRNQTRSFLLGIMQLLIKAAEVEIVYSQVKNFTENARYMQTEWQTRIRNLVPIYERIDQTVKINFATQYILDTIDYAQSNPHPAISHSDFARGLYNLLKNKYYWRQWIVFAYNPIRGWNLHTLSVRSGSGVCAGDTFLRQEGRNIWVQSCEENIEKLDVVRAGLYLRTIKTYRTATVCHRFGCGEDRTRFSADVVFDSLNLNEYIPCAAAVITKEFQGYMNTDLAYYGDTERLAIYSGGEYYHLIMWG